MKNTFPVLRGFRWAWVSVILAAGCIAPPPDYRAARRPDAVPRAAVVAPETIAPAAAAPAPAVARPAAPAPAQEPPAAKPAAPEAPPAARPPAKNVAAGAEITATSTHREWPGEGEARVLVDGDLATRWSSQYAEPQTLTIDLRQEYPLGCVRLFWEKAYALQYTVEVSTDGRKWNMAHKVVKTASPVDEPIDQLAMENVRARWIRIELLKRLKPEWGFSLYEIEVQPGEAR
jgi:hypothetical protein